MKRKKVSNPFLKKKIQPKKIQEVEYIPTPKDDVFDTLSDVSTNDSDIEITMVSIGSPQDVSSSTGTKPTDGKEQNMNDLYYLTLSTDDKSSTKQKQFDEESNSSASLDDSLTDAQSLQKKKQTKNKDQRFPNNPELQKEALMTKFWSQRYELFERFDMGIKLDKESWYSSTPEYISKEIAELCHEDDVVLDAFCGAGSNLIQFSYKCKKLYAVDIDEVKIDCANNNCRVYGVDMSKIVFERECFYQYVDMMTITLPKIGFKPPIFDVIFLSPPWGDQDYYLQTNPKFDLDLINIDKLMSAVFKLNPKRLIILYLPYSADEKAFTKRYNFTSAMYKMIVHRDYQGKKAIAKTIVIHKD